MEVSFPAFFDLTGRPGCQRERFPSLAAFRTFSFFTCACDGELDTRGRRSFKNVLISECFFFNLPFNMEKHLVPNQYIEERGFMEAQRHTTLTTTEVELINNSD